MEKYCFMCQHAEFYNPLLLYCTVKRKYMEHLHEACEHFKEVK